MKTKSFSSILLLLFSLSLYLKAQQKETIKPTTTKVQNSSDVALADATKPKITLAVHPKKKMLREL